MNLLKHFYRQSTESISSDKEGVSGQNKGKRNGKPSSKFLVDQFLRNLINNILLSQFYPGLKSTSVHAKANFSPQSDYLEYSSLASHRIDWPKTTQCRCDSLLSELLGIKSSCSFIA